jgi:hypothetical protein
MKTAWLSQALALAIGIGGLCPRVSRADVIPFSTTESSQYLLIGLGPVNTTGGRPGVGQAVNVNNFELGANKAPVPSTSAFGPGLRGNVPNIPLNAQPVMTGIGGRGNIAITHPGGVFNLQDVGVYADLGIRTAASVAAADAGTQNSFFNDPNQFPNTFTPTGTGVTGTPANNNIDGTGANVNPGSAVQATRIDQPNSAGVTGSFTFASLLAELDTAMAVIPGLANTATLDLTASGGKLTKEIDTFTVSGSITVTDTKINDGRVVPAGTGDNTSEVGNTVIQLAPGLNVIDIVTKQDGGGQDFLLQESSLVIDGPAGAVAIFRVPDNANFLVSNANILVGTGGIGLHNVLFYSDKPDNNQHFKFQNTVLNGVAFWTLGKVGGEINVQNGQGCTQFIADKIALDDVRFNLCAFGDFIVPEPSGVVLLGIGACSLALCGWRRLRKPAPA